MSGFGRFRRGFGAFRGGFGPLFIIRFRRKSLKPRKTGGIGRKNVIICRHLSSIAVLAGAGPGGFLIHHVQQPI